MTATNLPTITNLTDASVTEAGFKTQLTALFAALRERGDPLGAFGYIQNLGLAFSVSGNALTCALKQRDGSTNADATNVVAVPFRSATAANGSFIVRDITGALSLTVSSGSTLGHSSATASNTYWYLIDNSGTVELAVSSKFFGWSGIVSTTAEGGAGAADSGTVMYSATARTNVPFACVARTVDTQTTAGTWAAVPTSDYLAPFELLDSPAFTGTPTAPTQTAGDNSTKLATTAYADALRRGVLAFRITAGGSVGAAATTYLSSSGNEVNEGNAAIRMPFACTARNLYANSGGSPGASKNFTFTLRQNSTDTALTAAINGGNTAAQDTTHSVSLAAGDLLVMRLVTDAGASSSGGLAATIELF